MKVVEKYIKILTNLNYANRTIETYSHYLEVFLVEINKNPYHITTKEIEDYLLNKEYSSISKQNQIIGSIKLFAEHILGKKEIHLSKIKRPKKDKKLPKVIDAEILAEKINSISNLKHRSILALGLSCGLRISEVINLKWEHLDRSRNILNIVNGKGRKDRCTILNDNIIELLEQYWKKYKSKVYVFNGQDGVPQYSQSSIQRLVKKHIHRNASFHLLRHSYATYALDNGTEIKPLSVSMGHNSTKTTEIYHHTSNKSLKTIRQAM